MTPEEHFLNLYVDYHIEWRALQMRLNDGDFHLQERIAIDVGIEEAEGMMALLASQLALRGWDDKRIAKEAQALEARRALALDLEDVEEEEF